MKRPIRSRALLAAGIVAAAAAWPLAQAAPAAPVEPTVPAAIAVPEGNQLFLVGHAVGVQMYKCTVTTGDHRWEFVGPRAALYGDNGKLITTHFAGPSWRAVDGSTAVGSLVRGVAVDADAIAWLLLSATGTAGPDGDRLAGTTFIQRTATTGGVMPPAGQCDATTADTTVEVPYTADYHFWKATGSGRKHRVATQQAGSVRAPSLRGDSAS